MIVRITGTSGSGKSTLVRHMMDTYGERTPIMRPPRRRPIAYEFTDPVNRQPVAVLGHYEIANGGIDTIQDLDVVYSMVRDYDRRGYVVIFEGMNMTDGSRRTLALHEGGHDVLVIYLTTPLRECVASVRSRGHEISESSIARTMNKCLRAAQHMKDHGVPVVFLSREEARNVLENR